MSNHSVDPNSDAMKALRGQLRDPAKDKIAEKLGAIEGQLGATGRFPEGKLDPTDEGELAFAVMTDESKGLMILDFGKPVAWLSLTPESAVKLGNTLFKRAKELGHTVVVDI